MSILGYLRRHSALLGSLLVVCAGLSSGCRLPSHLPKFDTAESGWTQRQYQVVWKANKDAEEMVCDVAEGHHPDGRAYVEVSKPPLTLVSVRVAAPQWWVEYGPRPRSGSGRIGGQIPHLWVLVATQNTNQTDLKVSRSASGVFTWESRSSGERIEGIPER